MKKNSVLCAICGLTICCALILAASCADASDSWTPVKGSGKLSYMKGSVKRMANKVEVVTKYDLGGNRCQSEVIVIDCKNATYRTTLTSTIVNDSPVSLDNPLPIDREILGSAYSDLAPVLCSSKKSK